MERKAAAIAFLKAAAIGDVESAYRQFIAPNFIHHNQYFKGDRQSLMTAMIDAHHASPNESLEVKQIFEDGDTVITHSLVTPKNPSARPIAVVHIFRFAGDRVVELWDVGQELIENSPNEHSPF